MGENEHQSRPETWSIFGSDQEYLEPKPDCCIYRVPQYLRKINEEAYTPKLISIGPLHYGRTELMRMENQKRKYLSKFGERVNAQSAQILREFETYIKSQEQRIRDHYSVSSMLQGSKYVEMILHDAVFIIELFLRKYDSTWDFLLENPLAIHIQVDLLLLENQVPYFVLNDLYSKAFPIIDESHPSFSFLSNNFFNVIIELFINNRLGILVEQSQHFTDFLRCALVRNVEPGVQPNRGEISDLPNATKLKGSGLKFRGIKNKCVLDISLVEHGNWFSWCQVNYELRIPCIKIYDVTEGLFRNLMALEMFRYPTESHICNYAILMDYLIDTAKDVDLLVEEEIVVNCVGDNEAISKIFNRLCSHVTATDHSAYYDIAVKMKAHYKYPLNHLKATLKSVYFGNLWTSTATIAAALLLILTVIQTVCSIMQVI